MAGQVNINAHNSTSYGLCLQQLQISFREAPEVMPHLVSNVLALNGQRLIFGQRCLIVLCLL